QLPWRSTFGPLVGSVGLAIFLAGVLAFRRAKTTVNPLTPEATTTMVCSGTYRFTRKPDVSRFPLDSCGMGDLPLQLVGPRAPSPVRVVLESLSNHSGGKSLVRQIPAYLYGVHGFCAPMDMITAPRVRLSSRILSKRRTDSDRT